MNKPFALIYLLLLPLIWFAPLFGTGLLPWFSLSEVSIISGIKVLFHKDIALAILITLFVIIMPLAKAISSCLYAFGYKFPSPRVLFIMSKLSLLDIFLIAVTIVVVKGVGVGRVEILWGFWVFAAYVALGYSLAIRKIIS